MAYVYRHIREDKNQPFYIGIGSDADYKRAATVLGRNKYWTNIVKKTKWYFDILIDDISWDFACEKEKEFISIYGRVNKKNGILCNLTDGGEGACGTVVGEETRRKISEKIKGKPPSNKGKKMPPHQIEILRKVNTGRPSWNKGKKMSEEARRNNSLSKKGLMVGEKHPMWGRKMPDYVKEALRKANKDRPTWNKGKKLTEQELIEHTKKREKQMKPILMFDKEGNFIKEFRSVCNASKETKLSKGSISNACYRRYNTSVYGGYVWKFKNPLQ